MQLKERLDNGESPEGWEGFTGDDFGPFECESDGSPDGYGLWFHENESGNPESVAQFIHHLLAKFMPQEVHWFTWADWCSKPRLDEFSGGAAWINAKEIRWLSPVLWCQAQSS